MKLNELKDIFNLTTLQLEQLDKYANFLIEYNNKINLTAITDYEEIIEKHFYDSLLPLLNIDIKGSLLDVGTGAGFPGVILKIARPDIKLYLMDATNKKCIFLKELVTLLDLKDVEVINARAEEYSLKNREKYDYVTARAVTNMPALIEITGAMVKVGGNFIALRGKEGQNELKIAEKAIKTMGFDIDNIYEKELKDGSKRVIGSLKKLAKTSKKYPRQYSIISATPL